MKWSRKQKPQTADLWERTRRWFAFLPVTIGSETRWLEFVTVQERRLHWRDRNGAEWVKVRFVDMPAPTLPIPAFGLP